MKDILLWFSDNVWFVLFLAWGMPMGVYRSRFRKLVYQTDSWTINVKPVFVTEFKGLFTNLYPNNTFYAKARWSYLAYLVVYFVLFACWKQFG
jgi:peroxiredoxin Q/BCP